MRPEVWGNPHRKPSKSRTGLLLKCNRPSGQERWTLDIKRNFAKLL